MSQEDSTGEYEDHEGIKACHEEGRSSWQRKEEGCALVDGSLGPNTPAVALDDSFDDGETDTGTLKFGGLVEALKYSEKLINIFHIKSRPVITGKKHGFIFARVTSRFDHHFLFFSRIFDGVFQEVGPDKLNQHGITNDDRQFAG